MTEEVYAIWREEWQKQHPNQLPPTMEQVNSLMDLFLITPKEIFGLSRLEDMDAKE